MPSSDRASLLFQRLDRVGASGTEGLPEYRDDRDDKYDDYRKYINPDMLLNTVTETF